MVPHWYVKEIIGPAIESVPKKTVAKKKAKLNLEFQDYKGIKLQLINRGYPKHSMAKRYALGGTNQNVWIPNKHLDEDGTIRQGENIDYVFRKSQRQLELAGYTEPIIGIKRRSVVEDDLFQ
jgi:hypothetical protein